MVIRLYSTGIADGDRACDCCEASFSKLRVLRLKAGGSEAPTGERESEATAKRA